MKIEKKKLLLLIFTILIFLIAIFMIDEEKELQTEGIIEGVEMLNDLKADSIKKAYQVIDDQEINEDSILTPNLNKDTVVEKEVKDTKVEVKNKIDDQFETKNKTSKTVEKQSIDNREVSSRPNNTSTETASKTLEIKEISVVNVTQKNYNPRQGQYVSYLGGNELLKGELYDYLKDLISEFKFKKAISSIQFDFYVSFNGKIESVVFETEIHASLQNDIREVLKKLSNWQEGQQKQTVLYQVVVALGE